MYEKKKSLSFEAKIPKRKKSEAKKNNVKIGERSREKHDYAY